MHVCVCGSAWSCVQLHVCACGSACVSVFVCVLEWGWWHDFNSDVPLLHADAFFPSQTPPAVVTSHATRVVFCLLSRIRASVYLVPVITC